MSSADSVSSRTSTVGRASTARASARRWRWPPDRLIPCSPIRVSSPHGSSCTKPACATSSASAICSGVASGRPRVRFSRTDIENSVGSSNAVATTERSESRVRLRMSCPSMVIDPAVTSYRRGTRLVRTVLPEPVAPTTATVSPAARSRSTSCRTSCSASGNRKPTPRNRSAPARVGPARGCRRARSVSVSSTSAIRSAAVIASWVIESRNPSEATGHTSDSIRVMKATRVPMVSRPWPAAIAPKPSTMIRATLGMTSRKVQNRAETRTFSSEVACSRRARSSKRAKTWSARPNALITRRPCAPSSTEVARSPVWSCTSPGEPGEEPLVAQHEQHHRAPRRRARPGPAARTC